MSGDRNTPAIPVAGTGHPRVRPKATPAPGVWRRWNDIADLFDGADDPAWPTDRDRIDPG